MESVGGAKQAVMWNRWAGLKGSDVESVGGAKQAVMWNGWAGLNRQ